MSEPLLYRDELGRTSPPQVLDWLRAKGEGHLTRINDILANLMEAERRMGAGR